MDEFKNREEFTDMECEDLQIYRAELADEPFTAQSKTPGEFTATVYDYVGPREQAVRLVEDVIREKGCE